MMQISFKPLGIRNNIVAGFLTLLPVAASLALFIWLFNTVTSFIPSLVQAINNPMLNSMTEHKLFMICLRIISIFLILGVLFFVGLFTKFFLGKNIIKIWEKVIARIPVLSTVYTTLQQLIDALQISQKGIFHKVVLVNYPNEYSYAIGFITSDACKEINTKCGDNIQAVFVPTTPNPTSGFLLFVQQEKIVELDMSVTQGIQLVISGGTVKPESMISGKDGAPVITPAPDTRNIDANQFKGKSTPPSTEQSSD